MTETANPVGAPLTPIDRRSVSDAVFDQLRDRIVAGAIAVGSPLPAERALCEALGVNRSSVREALRRLEQARLVSVRHGSTSRVLDYRQSAGLDLLENLLLKPGGEPDTEVIRSVLEMRTAIAADAARLAATRSGTQVATELDAIVRTMREAAGDLAVLQELAVDFWSRIIDAADNIAYRLAYNSLRSTYDRCRDLLRHVLADELRDSDGYAAISGAIRAGDASASQRSALTLVRRGELAIREAMERHLHSNASRR